MSIELRNIDKRFGNFLAVDNVDLTVANGELVALLGPSGSGKTTLLRIIADLEWPDAGTVSFHGEDATDIHARDRQVGFVFQHYAPLAATAARRDRLSGGPGQSAAFVGWRVARGPEVRDAV